MFNMLNPTGWYLATNFQNPGQSTAFRTSVFSTITNTGGFFSFYYYIYGANMGGIKIWALGRTSQPRIVWSRNAHSI